MAGKSRSKGPLPPCDKLSEVTEKAGERDCFPPGERYHSAFFASLKKGVATSHGFEGKFEKEIRTALKAGRKDAVAVFRLTLSEIQAAEKDKRSPLEESEIVGIIRGAVKKRKEAVNLFRKGGRSDLVEKETAEAQLLEKTTCRPLSQRRNSPPWWRRALPRPEPPRPGTWGWS